MTVLLIELLVLRSHAGQVVSRGTGRFGFPKLDTESSDVARAFTQREMSGTGEIVRVREANSSVMLMCLISLAVPAGRPITVVPLTRRAG